MTALLSCCEKDKTNTVNKSSHSRLIHSENWKFILIKKLENCLNVHNSKIYRNYSFIFKYSFFIILKNASQNIFDTFLPYHNI